jgi:UDP:flavonoid glycosyltransferase YjiC (YdhE family)
VPVVAVPFGRDQPEVARRVEVAGAGVRLLPLARLTGACLREAVQQAMSRRDGARRIAEAFATAGGPTAADALEALAGQVTSPERQAPSGR